MYIVTGVDFKGKRFKPIRTTNWHHARMIVCAAGTIWKESDGKRKRVCRVFYG
jgi:hypothetical protein